MRYLLQTFWLSVKCLCSESAAREVIFADDPRPRRHRSRRFDRISSLPRHPWPS